MFKVLEPFFLAFIPLFVAVDAIGNIPLFISLVDHLGPKARERVIAESVRTAAAVAVLFMLIGKLVLRFLGITISDFQIAGGLLLFVISLRLLFPGASKMPLRAEKEKDVGVFPLGMPLITGPAVLTTTLMMLDSYGIVATTLSLVLNMLIVWVTLKRADSLIGFLGEGGTRAFSKIMYILLAAIGVMMVRRGVTGVILP